MIASTSVLITRKPFLSWLAVAGILLFAPGAVAEDRGFFKFSGNVGAEARWYPQNPAYPGQLRGIQASLDGELAFEWESADRGQQTGFVPFARYDAEDDERTHYDIREGYWRYTRNDWEWLVGIDRVFWGVTESRHLVNIVNQLDAVENIDEEDFLGQPMLRLNLQRDYGIFDAFVMPYFRERTFPGVAGRLRGPVVVDTDNPVYESSSEETHVDLALRYSHTLDYWDFGLSLFHGTGREPTLLPGTTPGTAVPLYSIITQAGLDLQFTGEAWLWKLEAIAREGQGKTFGALVGGFEYTFYQVRESALDVGVLAEYLYDGRDDSAPLTTLDDDVFVGSRLAFNDVQNSALLAGFIVDANDGTTSFRLEAERRLGQTWKMELESQGLISVDEGNPVAALDSDDFVRLILRKFW